MGDRVAYADDPTRTGTLLQIMRGFTGLRFEEQFQVEWGGQNGECTWELRDQLVRADPRIPVPRPLPPRRIPMRNGWGDVVGYL